MNFKQLFIIIVSLFLLSSCKRTNEELLNKAYILSKQKNYDKAIQTYTEIINRDNKLQLPYYNRGLAYVATKQYIKALADLNKVMALQTFGDMSITYNKDSPFADEEARAQVPYDDALYQRGQVKYFMDSLQSSFDDFQALVEKDYQEKSNCILWEGTICIKSGKPDEGCVYFTKARQLATTKEYPSEQLHRIKSGNKLL